MSEFTLIIRAIWLAVVAQKIRSRPLESVSLEMSRKWTTTRVITEEAALRVAARSCRIVGIFPGMRNTCLMRSLVSGALLSFRDDVILNVGFRSGAEGKAEGHAWVSVAGTPIDGAGPSGGELPDFVEVMKIPMSHRAQALNELPGSEGPSGGTGIPSGWTGKGK